MATYKGRAQSIRDKRKIRIRKKISGTPERPRLSVYRSLNHIYAQLVDDTTGNSLGMISTKTKALAGELGSIKGKVDKAKLVGKEIAKFALERNITAVVFDRNGFLYHGRVKAVADGAREGGLSF
jgi:large subunit ribosomal protein L18